MNQEEAKQFLPLIQAYAEGKTIQYRNRSGWVDYTNPSFSDTPDKYRVKPEPVVRSYSCVVYDDASCSVQYPTKAEVRKEFFPSKGSFIMTLTMTDGVPSATFEPYE